MERNMRKSSKSKSCRDLGSVEEALMHRGSNVPARDRLTGGDYRLALAVEPLEKRVFLSTTIADWTFETSAPTTAGPFNPEVGAGSASGHHAGNSTYSSPQGNGSPHSFSSNVWAVGDYYQFQVNTANLGNITLSFDQTSSATGPGQFNLQYSTNGSNFTTLNPYTVLVNGNGTNPPNGGAWGSTAQTDDTFTANLPSSLSDQTSVYIRLTDASTQSANQTVGGNVATTGTDRVDNVILTGTPVTIGSMTVNPASVYQGVGTPVTLTVAASNITDPIVGSTITGVEFYSPSYNSANPTANEVGAGTLSNGNWTYTVSNTSTLAVGNTTYLAVATDNSSPALTSPAASATLTVQPAVGIGSLTVSPPSLPVNNETPVTLTASNLNDQGGNITKVAFYEGTSPSGTFIGNGTLTGGNWTLSNVSTTGLSAGNQTFYTVATDDQSRVSAATSATLTVTNPQPIADWTFETSQPTTPGPISPELGAGSASLNQAQAQSADVNSSAAGNGSPHSFNSNNWTVGDYYQFEVNTASPSGLSNIGFQFDQSSSNTGPGTFQLQYSTNGSTFTPFSGNISNNGVISYTANGNYTVPVAGSPNETWLSSNPEAQSFYTFVPDLSGIQSAIANQSTLYFRLVDQNTNEADGKGTVTSTGTDAVDNVIVNYGSAPTITSLTATPGTVIANSGSTISLKATNVSDPNTNGQISEVDFYKSGIYIGKGTQSGGNWTLSNVYANFAPLNNPTFSAVARDTQGEQSSPATTTLTLSGTVVADWTFETTQPVGSAAGQYPATGGLAPEGGTEAGSSSAIAYHSALSTISTPVGDDSPHSFSSNVWSNGDYYQFQTSTAGENNIQLSFDQVSSSTGPAQFALQYSTNGQTFLPFTGNITSNNGGNIATSGNGTYAVQTNSGTSLWTGSLPTVPTTEYHANFSSITGLNNNSAVYFRLYDSSATSATGGTDRVDNVVVSGTDAAYPTIGTVSISPTTPIVVGNTANTTVTVTAGNITDTTGNIISVAFYEGSYDPANPTTNLIGNGTQSSGNWTLTIPNSVISTLPTGKTSILAVAKDSGNLTSVADSTQLTVIGTQQITLSSGNYSINENQGTITIPVTRTASPGYTLTANATVNFATSDGIPYTYGSTQVSGAAAAGTDYTSTSGNLTFTNGATTGNITVPIDNVQTFLTSLGTRTFNITLTQPVGSPATIGTYGTTPVAITDNAPTAAGGIATPTGNSTASNDVTAQGSTGTEVLANLNSTLAWESHNNYPYAAFPEIEFGPGSGALSGNYTAGDVDSVKLSLYNTSTNTGESGVPGTFSVYLLTNDNFPAGNLTYGTAQAFGASSVLTTNDYGAFADGFSSNDLVGSATFTNNVVGYNDFTFDNLTSTVKGALVNYFNSVDNGAASNPIRFIIIPTSPMSVNWAGNGSAQPPQLSLLVEKGIPEAIGLAPLTDSNATSSTTATINKGGSETITVNRSSLSYDGLSAAADLNDTVTVPYTLNLGATDTAAIGTNYTVTDPGTYGPGTNGTTTDSGMFTFEPGETEAQITINALATPDSADNPVSFDKTVSITLGTPTPPSNPAHTAFDGSILADTVTIHDPLTQSLPNNTFTGAGNVTDPANTTATISTGAVPAADNYVNVENTSLGTANETFGIIEFNTGNEDPISVGSEIGSINQVILNTVNDPVFAETAGLVNVYVTDDTTDSIQPGSSLRFQPTTADPSGGEGLGTQLDAGTFGLHLLGTVDFNPNQSSTSHTGLPVTVDPQYGAASLRVLANDINLGNTVRFVVAPAASSTASLRWWGAANETYAPTISLNYNPLLDFVHDTGSPTTTGNVTWNAATEQLGVTNPATMTADPATFKLDPNIVGTTAAAQLLIQPLTSNVDVHVGGITLANGAGIDMASVLGVGQGGLNGVERAQGANNVLVVGQVDQTTAPTFSIDSLSNLNLEDNDLIIHGDTPNADGTNPLFASVQAAQQAGRNGGSWVSTNGLTSTAAANQNANDGSETVQLAPVFNGDLGGNQYSNWTVGSAVEPLSATGNDIIVKYTYTGDFNLDGRVDGTDLGIIDNNYLLNPTGNEWALGDTNGDGAVDGTDLGIIDNLYGNGTALTDPALPAGAIDPNAL
jgi:hypothetical protein